jgi:hypothetical protein
MDRYDGLSAHFSQISVIYIRLPKNKSSDSMMGELSESCFFTMQNYTPVTDALRDQFTPGTATIPLATLEQATQLITTRSADLAGNNQPHCRRQGSQQHLNPAIALTPTPMPIATSPTPINILGTLSPETLNLITSTVNDVIAYLFPGGNSSAIGVIQDGLDYFIQNFSVDDLVAYLPEVLAFLGSDLTPAPIAPAPTTPAPTTITPAPITPTPVLSEAEELAQLLDELQLLIDNNPTLGITPTPTTPPPIATTPNPVITPISTTPIATTPTPTAAEEAELEALLAELAQLVNANSGL